MIESDVIIGSASQGDVSVVEGNVFDLWEYFLQVAATIVEGDADHSAAGFTDAKNVAMFERVLEGVVAAILFALIGETVQCLGACGMWVYEIIEAVALFYLKMAA